MKEKEFKEEKLNTAQTEAFLSDYASKHGWEHHETLVGQGWHQRDIFRFLSDQHSLLLDIESSDLEDVLEIKVTCIESGQELIGVAYLDVCPVPNGCNGQAEELLYMSIEDWIAEGYTVIDEGTPQQFRSYP